MWTLSGKRADLFASIAANPTQTSVRIKTKPSQQLFLRLLEQTKVKEIEMSAGLAKTVPLRVRDALEKAGVRLTVVSERAGRPARYPSDRRQQAVAMLGEKKTVREISAALGVPATAVYWWKLKSGMSKKRRKKRGKTAGAAASVSLEPRS